MPAGVRLHLTFCPGLSVIFTCFCIFFIYFFNFYFLIFIFYFYFSLSFLSFSFLVQVLVYYADLFDFFSSFIF